MTYRNHKQAEIEKFEREVKESSYRVDSELTKQARNHEIQRLNALQELYSVKAACEIRIEIKERNEQKLIKEINREEDAIKELKHEQQ